MVDLHLRKGAAFARIGIYGNFSGKKPADFSERWGLAICYRCGHNARGPVT